MLLFPTAGGDAEEVERFHLIAALEPYIAAGKLKVYSIDSFSGREWLTNDNIAHCVWIQKQFDEYLVHEVLPAIKNDCQSDFIEMITAGASIGAYHALLMLCRHPQYFHSAICMSGTYEIEKWLKGQWYDEFYHYLPLAFVPNLPEDDHLNKLRERFVLLTTGEGEYENPQQSRTVADVLGGKNIPNRVDIWDASWRHDWDTWRAMLPKYAAELLD
jgi:esterase/lipase superfamily enzyme